MTQQLHDKETSMRIVVLTNGFVLACRDFDDSSDHLTLTTVRCVRVWGTTEGLGQLVSGPTKDTKLDATIPIVSAPKSSLVFSFEVVASAWDKHLK
jgi:hypothetical protein